MKIDAKKLLSKSLQEKRAIPAFNVSSIEALQSVFECAADAQTEIIIETSKGESEHLNPELLASMCESLANIHSVDYVLHMDRCKDLSLMQRVLEAGYNSISAEFAETDEKKNIELSLKARELTHRFNAQLEGVMEVVPLVYYEKKKNETFTDPLKAVAFVKKVKPDSLVVSVGTQSGRLKIREKLDMSLLSIIHASLPTMPLVLHGGSFLPDEMVREAINLGVAKINVNSELRIAFTEKLKQNIQNNPTEYAPYRLLAGTKEAMGEIILQKIETFRSNI